MSCKGIDVSCHNGDINWSEVKENGVQFAFIRAGYGQNTIDTKADYNAKNAKSAGVEIHFYWFSYACSKSDVEKEAESLIAQAKKYTSKCMLAFDFEYDSVRYAKENGVTVSKATLTDWAVTFCNKVKAAGFIPVVYANQDYVINNLNIDTIISKTGAKLWFAKYASTIGSYGSNAYIWQYSSTGSVPGISTNCDMNTGYFSIGDTSTPGSSIDVTYQTYDDYANKWLPNVKNTDDYAGVFGHSVTGVYASLSKGNITYCVHVKGGNWLPAVKNRSDYAGILDKPIDGLMMKTDTGKKIHYRVHLKSSGKWLPYVTGYSSSDSNNGYAGVFGEIIDAIQVYVGQ